MSQQHSLRCPKCDGEMHEGFIADHAHGGSIHQEQWVQGQPERSIWFGVNVRNKDRYHVVTLRCADCGFLEAYAWEPA